MAAFCAFPPSPLSAAPSRHVTLPPRPRHPRRFRPRPTSSPSSSSSSSSSRATPPPDPSAATPSALRAAILASSAPRVAALLASSPSSLATSREVGAGGATALHLAAFRGDAAVVSALLGVREVEVDAGNDAGQTPLHMAAIKGRVEVVRALLRAGADGARESGDRATALDYAMEWGQEECVDVLTRERVMRVAGEGSAREDA